jgi:hypothetical protein
MGLPMTSGKTQISNSIGNAPARPQRPTFPDERGFGTSSACDDFLHVSSTYPRFADRPMLRLGTLVGCVAWRHEGKRVNPALLLGVFDPPHDDFG